MATVPAVAHKEKEHGHTCRFVRAGDTHHSGVASGTEPVGAVEQHGREKNVEKLFVCLTGGMEFVAAVVVNLGLDDVAMATVEAETVCDCLALES